MKNMTSKQDLTGSKTGKITSKAVFLFYTLIMMEGILMATPFGLFLYSFYLPFLQISRGNRLTAWLAGFFLPHSVSVTDSVLINFLSRSGPYLFLLGLAGFLIFASQVYYAKIRRKGMVHNFVYAYIRHPQYLFFMISGIGLLFIWPRMMMLVLFTLMSIGYFYLAKHEEGRMLAKYPDYEHYIKKTAMFIPGNPGGLIYQKLTGWLLNRKIAQLLIVILTVILLFACALGLRRLTIDNLSYTTLPDQNMLALSVFPHTEQYIRDAVTKALTQPPVKKALIEQGNVSFSAHILPGNYGMIGMFAELNNQAELAESFRNRTSLRDWLWGTESDHVKVVFSKIDKPGIQFVPLDQILDLSAKMTPVLVVDMNLTRGEMVKLYHASTTHYGEVPQPIF